MSKSSIDIHASVITKFINLSLRNDYFPDDLKAAEVTPRFKKNVDLEKDLKVFERIMLLKLKVLWKISYRNCLQDSEKIIAPNTVSSICLKNGKIFLTKVVLFVPCLDFSKAFDTMNHNLLIAQLRA